MSNQRPLRLFIDEGGDKIRERDFPLKFQQARHLGIGIAINVQNASDVPPEVTTNCSMLVAFQCTDGRDRLAVERAMSLSKDQAAYLGELGVGECIVYLPQSGWPRPVLARVPEVIFDDHTDAEVAAASRAFAAELDWEPITAESAELHRRHAGPFGDLDTEEEAFLRDVLNQKFEGDPIGLRFERAGVRSGEKQGRVVKKLLVRGYVSVHALAVGRGRPWKLVEPTEKAFDAAGVKWKKSRGSLPTRVATKLLHSRVKKLVGWSWTLEGELG